MRKIVIAVMSTLSIMVLVFSFDASRRGDDLVTTAARPSEPAGANDGAGDGAQAGDPTESADGDGGNDTEAADPTESSSEPAPATSTEKAARSGTFTGESAQTQWGPVRVQIVVRNGKIVKAKAVDFPQENHHDVEINSWAIPQLEQATVDNNGNVDSYSGATVTCDGYRRSLQSALDQAHL